MLKISHPIQSDVCMPYKFFDERVTKKLWSRTDHPYSFLGIDKDFFAIVNLSPMNSTLRFVVADFDVPQLPGFDPSLIVNFAKASRGTCKPFRGPKGDVKLLFAIRAHRFANFRARDALKFLNETLPPELRHFNKKAMTTTVANKNTWSDLYDAMNGRDFDNNGHYFGELNREFYLVPSKFIFGVVEARSIELDSIKDDPSITGPSQLEFYVNIYKKQFNKAEKVILEHLLAHPNLGDEDGGMIPQAWYAKQIVASGKAKLDKALVCRFLIKLKKMNLLIVTDEKFIPGKKAKSYRFEGPLAQMWKAASIERTVASQTAHLGATYA